MFDDDVVKISLECINQTKDEMLKEVEAEKEVNKLHAVKVLIATSITQSLTIPSPNTEEDANYMDKLGFILNKDKHGKFHVALDKAKKESEAGMYIKRVRGLRKEAADVVMKKIKEAMAINENKIVIGSDIYDRPYRSRLKYFDVWLSPELEKAGFKATLINENNYSISW